MVTSQMKNSLLKLELPREDLIDIIMEDQAFLMLLRVQHWIY
ncbi:MAG: hypothetical protein P8Y97_15485 [Candidatus Lokiarchaeota archaeon]